MLDLHTHSLYSDGTDSPRQLVDNIQKQQIKIFSLCDHDTVKGLAETRQLAEEAGISFVPGLEIEIEYPSGEFHLLGLGIDYQNPALLSALDKLAARRSERNLLIVENMRKNGHQLEYQDILDIAGDQHVVGRLHFARYLEQSGKVKNIKQAFDRYLKRGAVFYEVKEVLSLEEALFLIKQSGGISIIAHPGSLYLSWGRLPEQMQKWKEMGIQGLEVSHPGIKLSQSRRYRALAEELGLLITGGSDYHGPNRPDRKLGRGSGKQRLERDYLPQILWENPNVLRF